LIGNKCDLDDDERAVTTEEAQEWVEEFKEDEEDFIDITFMEVSARDGTNV
jgi:GTPase SAR1 family protein